VTALVHTVTEGGKASRRRRVLAMLAGATLLAGGATLAAVKLVGGSSDATPDALLTAVEHDAEPADAIVTSVTADAALDAAIPDAGRRLAMSSDAGLRARPDARTHDAQVADASVAVDAVPMAAPADAAVAATGFIVVKSDAWCEVSIDGSSRGRASEKPLRVEAGSRTVVCEQTGMGNKWTRVVDVVAGKTVTASGSLLGNFVVTVSVDAAIDGIGYTPGMTAILKRGRHDLVIGGSKSRFDLSAPCTIRSTPEPGCY
jgi:hypothetical protein